MGANLKSGDIPAGVFVGGPSDISVLNIIGSFVVKDIHREMSLQQIMLFLPVNGRFKIYPGDILVEYDILPDLQAK